MKSLKNMSESLETMTDFVRLRPLFWKYLITAAMFDHVLICLLINTSAPSHWLKSVAWPVGPVLKFRDIPDCYLFSVQTMWSIFLRILSLRLQKAFEVPYKQKKISSTVWKWQSSVKISGWVLTFAEPCFIRNFFGKNCVWSLATLSAMVTDETLNTAVITTDLLFRLSRCRLYLIITTSRWKNI